MVFIFDRFSRIGNVFINGICNFYTSQHKLRACVVCVKAPDRNERLSRTLLRNQIWLPVVFRFANTNFQTRFLCTYLKIGERRHQVVQFPCGGGGAGAATRGGHVRRYQLGFPGESRLGFRLLHSYGHLLGAGVDDLAGTEFSGRENDRRGMIHTSIDREFSDDTRGDLGLWGRVSGVIYEMEGYKKVRRANEMVVVGIFGRGGIMYSRYF